MTDWKRGPAEDFWMEDNPPSGTYDNYIVDSYSFDSPHYVAANSLLHLLSSLGILDYGTIYDSIDCIRIKVRNV